MSSTPEKEKKFQELKKKHGSIFAFHGSALCNWHNILRNGLKNMSNSAGMKNVRYCNLKIFQNFTCALFNRVLCMVLVFTWQQNQVLALVTCNIKSNVLFFFL